MNKKALKTLEYYKIIDKLTSYASSSIAKEMCSNLEPSNDIEEVNRNLQETSDALTRVLQKGSISFHGIHDIRGSVKRLEIGSVLGMVELLRISSLLDTTLRIKSYSRGEVTIDTADSLDELFNTLEPLSNLNNEIKRCIISEEEMSDDASPTLKSIRRSRNLINEKIRTQLNAFVSSASTNSYLQDNVVTMRNGRYCIPVKSEYKNHVAGMVHDQSSTGSTFFIEPMAIVKLNNELTELDIKEQKEIERILAELSNEAATYCEQLKDNLTALTTLDFIFAKAMLSKNYNCSAPIFNTRGYINIKKGRHPLLEKHKVVPIDIHLGDTFDLLIVTGPNTGGKTVSLKTVGLFTLMGQAGLHIPAFDNSELALFNEVYADIGDEQSIEQSLSTFSSHMTNIVSILDKADSNSLCLFDELCAGTDPTEGAALAISILSRLHQSHIRTMATTHYSEIKIFALSEEGVENACCEFDVESLSPTYRLLIGIPGKSNAFAISSKLGLPSYIIDDAKTRLSSEDESFEDVISELENSKIAIEREKEEIRQYKDEIASLKKKLEEKQDNIEARRDKIIRDANEEAHKVLREAKEYADSTIRTFNKLSKNGMSAKDMENERNKLRGKMSDVESKLSYKSKAKAKKEHKATDFRVGDAVKVLSLNLNGTVSTLPNQKGDLFVQMGILRSQVNIKDLELLDEPVITGPNKMQKTSSGKIKMSKSMSVSTEINLIGMTVDEALAHLDKYLDDAYISHLPQVTVVHGKGTGALRAAVHNHLKRMKYVKSFRLGAYGEGEAGVTVVEFK